MMRSILMPRRSHHTDSLDRFKECVGAGERNAVVGADGIGQAEILEGTLEHSESVGLFGGGQAVDGDQISAGIVGDRERIAVALVGEHELAFVVCTPQRVRRRYRAERGPHGLVTPA